MTDEQDRRLSCCLTFDFDAMSAWIGTFQSENPSMISRGEFGAAVGLPRILDLLQRRGIRATFCVPGHTARAYPGLARRIHEEGHELVHHGWVHENPADFDREGRGGTSSWAWRRSIGPRAFARKATARPPGTSAGTPSTCCSSTASSTTLAAW